MGQQGLLERPVLVPKVLEGLQVRMVPQDPKDQKVLVDPPGLKGQRVIRDIKGGRDLQDSWVLRGHQVNNESHLVFFFLNPSRHLIFIFA